MNGESVSRSMMAPDDDTRTGPGDPARSGTRPADSDAGIRELYEAHGAALLTFLVRLTRGDRHRAEDILQETLLRAWRHPEARVEPQGWSRPWLFTVARRIAVDHVRASMARPTELGDDRLDERPMLDDDLEKSIDHDQVRAALMNMPARFRDVLVQIYFLDRSGAEAAEALGVPEGTVKSRTFYALRALRAALLERGFLTHGAE